MFPSPSPPRRTEQSVIGVERETEGRSEREGRERGGGGEEGVEKVRERERAENGGGRRRRGSISKNLEVSLIRSAITKPSFFFF